MSLSGKKWIVKNQDQSLGVFDKLLQIRKLDDPQKQEDFFSDDIQFIPDPFELTDMKEGVERIRKAIDQKEKVMVFGDYDVDGITSSAIVYGFLKQVGVDAHCTLPSRQDDGYGLKDYFIKQFKEQGIQLLITVDCGTANFEEIKLAKSLGIDVVITDHHTVPEMLPPTDVIINPKRDDCNYPNKNLSGSGVAYKLISALAPYYLSSEVLEAYLFKTIGLATLGLISDCMPLTGENRILVKHGLKSLQAGTNPGVFALLKEAGISTDNITSSTVGFYIGPRLNAAGRLDHPKHSFELLLGDLDKANDLNKFNETRKQIVQEYIKDAQDQINQKQSVPNIILLRSSDWHIGTLGLIAGRICDSYHRPTAVVGENDGDLVCSFRSLDDFDMTGFFREHFPNSFKSFGGHKLAGGFSMEKDKFDQFSKDLESISSVKISPDDFSETLNIDCEINPGEFQFSTKHQIDKLEPFGNGNPEPTLIIKNINIDKIRSVGKQGEHLQFPVEYGDKKFGAIAFRFGHHLDKINPENRYDIAFNLEINEWNGYKKLQMRVVDMRESE